MQERPSNASPHHRARRWWRWCSAVAGLLAALGGVYWQFLGSASSGPAGAVPDAPVSVSVRVARAERQPIAAQVTAIGTLFPRSQATVSARVAGQLTEMPLLRNLPVQAGQVLARLEAHDLRAQRAEAAAALQEARINRRAISAGAIPQAQAQAEKALHDARANLAQAQAAYERRHTLYTQGGIAAKDLEAARLALTLAEDALRLAEQTVRLRAAAINPNDQAMAEARVRQAEARLATLDAQLDYTTIRAPLSGIVTEQWQFAGEYVAPGTRLCSIADLSTMRVQVPFADTTVAHLRDGDQATILPADLPGVQLTGRIALISRATDPQARAVEVWVSVQNSDGRLRAGGAAQVSVTTQQASDAVVVPLAAVTLDGSTSDSGTVMVVDAQSIAHAVSVTVGIRTADRLQILSGLQGGETVITAGNYALPDGTRVRMSETAMGEHR